MKRSRVLQDVSQITTKKVVVQITDLPKKQAKVPLEATEIVHLRDEVWDRGSPLISWRWIRKVEMRDSLLRGVQVRWWRESSAPKAKTRIRGTQIWAILATKMTREASLKRARRKRRKRRVKIWVRRLIYRLHKAVKAVWSENKTVLLFKRHIRGIRGIKTTAWLDQNQWPRFMICPFLLLLKFRSKPQFRAGVILTIGTSKMWSRKNKARHHLPVINFQTQLRQHPKEVPWMRKSGNLPCQMKSCNLKTFH